MSQAPVLAEQYQGADRIFAEATDELNRQVDEGTSWSGNERNNVFLNLGANRGEDRIPKFAEISALTGFDFPDDSRGLVSLDWDFDGDLDFITTNRTAPRVRIFENRLIKSSDASVSIRLIGKTANRDAIGSWVELTIIGSDGSSVTLERSLHGGQGFVSQSSKRLHFGIPAGARISEVRVFWNSREVEEIAEFPEGRFWNIEQGAGRAEEWNPPHFSALEQRPAQTSSEEDRSTVIANLARPIPLPAIPYLDPAGSDHAIEPGHEKIMVVNLWATWCQPCLQELREFSEQKERFKDCDFLALCVDASPDEPETMAAAQRILEATGFPFENGFATEKTMQLLHSAHNIAFARPAQLPVPTTLILAPGSRIATVIRGQVHPAELEPILTALREGSEAWESFCQPAGPGRWVYGPDTLYYVGLVKEMLEQGKLDQAAEFLQSQYEWLKPEGRTFAEMLMLVGTQFLEKGQHERGIGLLESSVEIAPALAAAQNNLAVALLQKNRGDEAVSHLIAALNADPGFIDPKINLARYYATTGSLDRALDLVEPILEASYHSGAIRVKAQVLVARGQNEKLKEVFQTMAQNEPNDPSTWINLAKLQLSQGARERALISLEKASSLVPSDTGLRTMIESLKAGSPAKNK